jgi:nucleoside-specific outer membrane channel protein Tsx
MTMKKTAAAAALLAAAAAALPAAAADWSDTAIGWRYGTRFAEPYGATDIHKNIISLTHASGYKYGTNFFNADVLLSDSRDPGSGTSSGAQEVYVVYRNTLDFGKIAGKDFKAGLIRSYGLTLGFDLNSKNDSYGSKKRMLVVGPTLMLDVPGFVNLSLLALRESNAPNGVDSRYTYKTHAAAEADWAVPLGALPLSFEGYALYIASKGANEFGGATKPETHVDMKLMADVGSFMGMGKNTLKAGVAYEYWRNKFGNPTTDVIGPGAGPGATARTPMVRVEYHL